MTPAYERPRLRYWSEIVGDKLSASICFDDLVCCRRCVETVPVPVLSYGDPRPTAVAKLDLRGHGFLAPYLTVTV